jgi:ribonuclease BN (tRNA processing enzyme)
MGKLMDLDVGCANSSIILTNKHAILVDCYGLDTYNAYLPQNKMIDVLFITHQHHDHFDGISYLLDNNYSVNYLVYSPYKRRYDDSSVELDEWNDFLNFKARLEKKGTKPVTTYRQIDFEKPFCSYDNLKCYMIGPVSHIANSETRELHDASLLLLLKWQIEKPYFLAMLQTLASIGLQKIQITTAMIYYMQVIMAVLMEQIWIS